MMVVIGVAAAIGVGAYAQSVLCRWGVLWSLYTVAAYLLVWAVLSIVSLGDFGAPDQGFGAPDQGSELLLDLVAAGFACFFVSAMARRVSR